MPGALRVPEVPPEETINVILDSTGGPLDSAFRTALYLTRYAARLNVYVPRKAKSASTLIAVAGHTIFMSPFSELGPLDTQIRDPRNPTDYISALDCYQSVDYVREFGFSTLSQALKQLAAVTQGKLLLTDSLDAAAKFAIGSITPMLSQTRSLDFGAWGRSLKIGERYAEMLLSRAAETDQGKAEKIASRLVYGYTHHLFPIDVIEARDIGLNPQEIAEDIQERDPHRERPALTIRSASTFSDERAGARRGDGEAGTDRGGEGRHRRGRRRLPAVSTWGRDSYRNVGDVTRIEVGSNVQGAVFGAWLQRDRGIPEEAVAVIEEYLPPQEHEIVIVCPKGHRKLTC